MEHIPVKELTLFLEGFFALIAYSGESWFVSRFLAFFFFFFHHYCLLKDN